MDKQKLAEFIAKADCDIYVYSGPITQDGADKIIAKILENKTRRSSGALMLTTHGGDPNAAYRIARILQRTYNGFTIYVFGLCKSAGTLLALGAKEIVMTDFGELGPLDIQIPKVDELNHESGLVYSQALLALRAHAFDFFETCYLTLKERSGGTISTRTASTIASSLAVGLFSPLAEQIDPLKVGEATRALDISFAYGSRLTTNTAALNRLINEYTNHGFVIDLVEAKELLGNVRQLNEAEEEAIGPAKAWLRNPPQMQQLVIAILDELLQNANSVNQKGESDDADQQSGEGSNPEPITQDTGDRAEKQQEPGDHPEATHASSAGPRSSRKSKKLG